MIRLWAWMMLTTQSSYSVILYYDSVTQCEVCIRLRTWKSLAQINPLLSLSCVVLFGPTMLLSPGSYSIPGGTRQRGLFFSFFIYTGSTALSMAAPWAVTGVMLPECPLGKKRPHQLLSEFSQPCPQSIASSSFTWWLSMSCCVNLPHCFFPDAGINPDRPHQH